MYLAPSEHIWVWDIKGEALAEDVLVADDEHLMFKISSRAQASSHPDTSIDPAEYRTPTAWDLRHLSAMLKDVVMRHGEYSGLLRQRLRGMNNSEGKTFMSARALCVKSWEEMELVEKHMQNTGLDFDDSVELPWLSHRRQDCDSCSQCWQ